MEKNDSAAALSSAQPTRPIDWVILSRRQAAAKASEVYWGAFVGVEDHPCDVAAAGCGGHVDRVGGELRRGVGVGLGEAQHAPRVQVLDSGEEHGSLVGVDLLEVAYPLVVGPWAVKSRRSRSDTGAAALSGRVRARRRRLGERPCRPWRTMEDSTVFFDVAVT